MRSLHPRPAAVVALTIAAASAFSSAASAQTPYRAACDLLDDATVSEVLGVEATAQRQGTRTMCTFVGEGGSAVAMIWLHLNADDMAIFRAQQGSEPITVGGVEGVTFPAGGFGRVVLSLPDGGLLDVTASPPDTDVAEQLELATAFAELILGTGPVTAVPADRGEVEALYVSTTLCDALSADEVNAITGGGYAPPDSVDQPESCYYPATEGFRGLTTTLTADDGTIDVGTYTSEEVTVAGRPAVWDPDYGWLDVDAGADRRLHANLGTSDEEDPALREQLVGIVEAIIPRLTAEAPPTDPPAAGCDLPLEEVSRITGLEIAGASPFGLLCFYTTAAGTTEGALVGIIPGDDPAAALEAADFSSAVAPTETQIGGRPALVIDAPEGAFIAIDLDGLADGDGQVLVAGVGGLASAADQLAAATALTEFIISRM